MKKREDIVARSGFTLIEMLVVVLIILMLSAMLFKIAGMVSGKAARAKAVADIANVQYALAEYYSEYNIYPPTSKNKYVYENTAGQDAGLKNILKTRNDPKKKTFITDSGERVVSKNEDWSWGKSKKGHLGYEYGLVSYLYLRDRGGQSHWYDKDTDRDISAKIRWQHFLKDVDLHSYGLEMSPKSLGLETTHVFTNSVASMRDPWDNDYVYECKPPYMKYKFYSIGPDHANNTGDDINNDSFNE